MTIGQIALITYTIRDHCQSVSDFADSMRKVSAIGYRAVQISGVGPIPPETIKEICDANGLTICATHEKGVQIVEHPEEVAKRLEALGTRYTAYPFPHRQLQTPTDVRDLVRELNHAGSVLAQAGKVLCYHNHNHEMVRLEGGRTVLESIYEETDPALVKAEPDTYWLQAGGASPLTWILKLKGRLPILHLKDAGTFMGEGGKPELRFTSVGDGNLEWDSLIAAARESGVEWYVVEQDRHWIHDDPFEAAERSFNYLAGMLARS